MTKITEGSGDFKLSLPITKSYEKEVDGERKMYVAGLASGVGLDLDGERMADAAIEAFKKAVDVGLVLPNGKWSYVPLRTGHQKEWHDALGWITKAEIDDERNLWIEAELDETSSIARDLFTKLTRGDRPGKPLQLGLSVGGTIKKATREWDANLGRSIRIIEDVVLKEISVVGSPAYPPSYVEALTKSVNWDEVPPPQEEISKEYLMKLEQEVKKVEETVTSDPSQPSDVANAQNADAANAATNAASTNEANADANAANAQGASTEEANKADPQADLRSQMASLQSDVSRVSEQLSAVAQQVSGAANANAESNKSSTKETTTVEKATIDVDALTVALSAVLEKFTKDAIEPMNAKIDAVNKAVEEIAAQPMDKSIAVRGSKESESALEKFTSKVSADKNANIIGEAVRAAMGQ